jgi:SAM-dependent methyltransferase
VPSEAKLPGVDWRAVQPARERTALMFTYRIRPLRWAARIVVAILGGSVLAFAVIWMWRRVLRPGPMPPRLAPLLLIPWRSRVFGSAEEVLDRAGVQPGMRVLEIGTGAGYFTVPLARRLAAQGRDGGLTCVEIQPEIIAMLHERMRAAGVQNVEVIRGDGRQLPLPDASFDLVFAASVIGETPDVPAFFRECARVLKPGGILAVNDFILDPDFRFPSTVQRLAGGAGLMEAGLEGFPWWTYTARYQKPVV